MGRAEGGGIVHETDTMKKGRKTGEDSSEATRAFRSASSEPKRSVYFLFLSSMAERRLTARCCEQARKSLVYPLQGKAAERWVAHHVESRYRNPARVKDDGWSSGCNNGAPGAMESRTNSSREHTRTTRQPTMKKNVVQDEDEQQD